MKYIKQKLGNPGICLLLCALLTALAGAAAAQAFGTTTVEGKVYLANGATGSGTLQLSWPAFTTAANQAVAAGRTNVNIGSDGFVSVNLAPNLGATPAGLFYTAVYHLSDGTTSTEYWVVPAAAQAALAQVRAQVMPAAQAVQAVNKAYVDQSIAQLVKSQVTSSGGNMTGPLYLNGDPLTSPQAATKHYVDSQVSQTLSINGGAANGPLTATQLGAAYQADQFAGSDFGAKLQACISALDSTYGGSCDARNFSGTLSMGSNLTIAKGNVTINLPCATIATSSQIVVTAGTRNVTLHGCASRGTSAASGSQGGTVFMYSGNASMVQVGDATYAANTLGFHLDNVALNTTSSSATTARAVTVWRAQEVHLESLYLLGNANQTGITLDGTGNYTGGTFQDVEIVGFQTALNAVGHQVANAATTDWVNASTFVRLHINCPTSDGSAIAGTTGINLAQGDGNTFTGGDVEGCATALHLGPNAQNNTIVGLRNENSTSQVVADAGSAYNNWITGGTMFTGKLTDNGTRNSFLDTFHRSFNALNGDWFGSQQDSTITNHYRLGIGSGNERGLLHRYQTDSGYRWTMGLSDATAGEQYYTVLDELNNVNRLSIGQYNTGQGSSNNQTVVNAAGTGAVVLNGSNNAGSGGVVFGSGGPSSTTVATINNAGNAQFNGSLQVSGASTFLNSTSIKNQADAEIDAFLWAGATAPQKESVVYKDWNGTSQWYMVKDTSNNWALNSAVGGVDSFKAYQANNSGDTYIDAANNLGVVRVNYEPGSGSAFNVYGGSSSNLYASFNGATGIKFPGLAAGSGKNCVQIDNSGYLSNTGSACAGSSVGAGTAGQIAYYPGNGSAVAGMTAIPIGSGGTGSTSASGALASLGGLPASGGTLSGPLAGTNAVFSGNVAANAAIQALTPHTDIRHGNYGAVADGTTDAKGAIDAAIIAAMGAGGSGVVYIPDNTYIANASAFVNPSGASHQLTIEIEGTIHLGSTFVIPKGASIKCAGKGGTPQYASGTASCSMAPPPAHGTLGTAITSTNTPITITPVFAGGSSIANLPAGSAITMVGKMTCPVTSVTRTALSCTYPGLGPSNVTATLSSACRIPQGELITIAGFSDSSFNTNLFVQSSDFPAQTMSWRQCGAAATSTGGTVTGVNLDSFETERIESVNVGAGTVTLRTNHTHAATDTFGEVGMAGTHMDLGGAKTIEGVDISGAFGADFWGDGNDNLTFKGTHFTGQSFITSVPIDFSTTYGYVFANSDTRGQSGYAGGCPSAVHTTCFDVGMPFDIIHDMLPQSLFATNAVSAGYFGPNSTVYNGIYITPNGSLSSAYLTGPTFVDSILEQPSWNGVTFDNRGGGAIYQTTFIASLIQDYTMEDTTWVGMSDAPSLGGNPQGQISFYTNSNTSHVSYPGGPSMSVNKYYCGSIDVHGASLLGTLVMPPCPEATVTYNDGRSIIGEINSNPKGTTYVPYATQAVNITASSWTASGSGSTIVSGQADPFSGTNAALVTAPAGTYSQVTVGTFAFATSPGDVFLYGFYTTAAGNMGLTSFGADTYDRQDIGAFAPAVIGLGWHPVVGFNIVKTGAASHTVQFYVTPLQSAGGGSASMSMPFVIYIPASANIPISEIQRWRTEMLHGYVPPSLPGGPVQAMSPADVLYWGGDTSIKRNAAGVLESNGSLILDGVATSPSTLPVCPNGSGGKLTTSGCTLPLSNSGVAAGSYTNSSITVDARGIITAASNGSSAGFLNGFMAQCMITPGPSMNCQGDYVAATGTAGVGANASSTSPLLTQLSSTTTTGNSAGWAGGGTYYPFYAPAYPLIKWGIAYSGAADYSTNARIQLGPASCSGATMAASDTPACSYVQIQHSTARGDTNYKCVSDNGSGTPTITDMGVAPTTAFTQMSISYASGTATCTVGGTSVTNASKIPTGALETVFYNTNLGSAAVHIQMFGWQVVHQNRAY